MKPYRAVIIGAGQMGAGISPLISHAAAYKMHEECLLTGIYDLSTDKLKLATNQWQVPGYQNIDELMQQKPDIVSICSIDDVHAEQLEKVAAYTPQAILLEKPVAVKNGVVQYLTEKFKTSAIVFAVNYTRRYLTIYENLKQTLLQQKIRAITIRYAKGLKHNGSHAIDLIRFLVGEIVHFSVLSVQYDYLPDDPSVSLHLKTLICDNIILQALDHNDYVHFEVDIFTDLHRYFIHQDHQLLLTYNVKDNHGIPLGKRLVLTDETSIPHQDAVFFMLKNVIKRLKGDEALVLSLTEALKTEEVVHKISEEALKIQQQVKPVMEYVACI